MGLRFRVRDAFVLTNRGTVVVGTVEGGELIVGAALSVERTSVVATVQGIDYPRDGCFTSGQPASVALFLPELAVDQVQPGDVLISG